MNYLKPKNQPLVSVLMPVYNAMPYLKEAIASVLAQTYKNFELVIVDDGSTDGSWQLIKKYKNQDKRIKAFRNRNKLGVSTALNKGINKSCGRYIARMDADDVMVSQRLEKQVKFLQKHKNVVALGSWTKEINEQGKTIGKRILPIKHPQICEMMYYLMGLQHPSVIFNRKLIPADFEWYKESVKKAVDLDLLFRLLKYGKFGNLPEYLMFYRIHKNNMSLKKAKKIFFQAQKIRKKAVRNYGYQPTLKAKIWHFIENIIISIVPERYILSLYSAFRNLSALFNSSYAFKIRLR